VSLLLPIALLCVTAVPAFAERSIVVEVVDAAPFDAHELTSAMRVRLPSEGAPIRVRVSAASDGVRVEAQGNVRAVQLGDLRGAAAARLVALAANDLLLEDLAIEPLPPPRSPATSIGVLGAATAWQRPLGGLAFDLAVPRGRYVLALDAGGSQVLAGPLSLSAAVIRASAGVRAGMFELRAGATFAPLFVDEGIGDRTILAGAGASLRFRFPIASGVGAVLAGGADVFATRTTYVIEGMSVLTTPRAAPWLAAGVEVTP
jgi:hypothetical protein